MSDQKMLSDYGKLVRNLQDKASASDRFVKNDDPSRPGRDEEFSRVQEDLKHAMHELEEFWRKVNAGGYR